MSAAASGSQIIFADVDGLTPTGSATWTVVVGPVGVVVVDEADFPELPQAANNSVNATETGTSKRVRTGASGQILRPGHRSGAGRPPAPAAGRAIAFAGAPPGRLRAPLGRRERGR